MCDVFIESYFPDRDYLRVPSVSKKLRDLGVAAVWLPYSPDAKDELEAAGYFPLFSYRGQELRIGQETPKGLQSFEDKLLEGAAATEKVAVLSSTEGDVKVALRQVWVVGRPGFSD